MIEIEKTNNTNGFNPFVFITNLLKHKRMQKRTSDKRRSMHDNLDVPIRQLQPKHRDDIQFNPHFNQHPEFYRLWEHYQVQLYLEYLCERLVYMELYGRGVRDDNNRGGR